MTTPTLDIQQPQPFDLVDSELLIAGNAAAFEGTLSVRLDDGHDQIDTFITISGIGITQFQGSVSVPADAAFKLPRLFLRLADDTGNEDGPSVMIPVLYGPLIMPGYTGWFPYTVKAGDTLTKIAKAQYGTNDFAPIFAANQHVISDPNLIFVGQELRIPRSDT